MTSIPRPVEQMMARVGVENRLPDVQVDPDRPCRLVGEPDPVDRVEPNCSEGWCFATVTASSLCSGKESLVVKFNAVLVFVMIAGLAGCQKSGAANPVEHSLLASTLPAGSGQAIEGAQCNASEQVVISCRLQARDEWASICANTAPASSDLKFRFSLGKSGGMSKVKAPEIGHAPSNDFRRSRLMLMGGAGGLVFSTTIDGARYALYSIQGKGFAIAGLQESAAGEARAISNIECDMSTLLETEDERLQNVIDTWAHDQSYENKGLL